MAKENHWNNANVKRVNLGTSKGRKNIKSKNMDKCKGCAFFSWAFPITFNAQRKKL